MNARYLPCFARVLGMAACSSSGSGDEAPTTAPPPATTTTTTNAPLALTVEGPQPKPGIEARVKAEVNERSDGITGTAFPLTGARAALQAPTGWTTTKGDIGLAVSADKKAQLAASGVAAGGAEGKLPAIATALGLTACEWNPPESLLIGKSTISGTGADGACMKGATRVKAAYVAGAAEGFVVVGAWEDGGDMASVFGSMRSILKLAGGGGDPLSACCAALRQNANSAPPDQKNSLIQAAAICDGLRNSPQGKAGLSMIRGMLKGANMPSSCR